MILLFLLLLSPLCTTCLLIAKTPYLKSVEFLGQLYRQSSFTQLCGAKGKIDSTQVMTFGNRVDIQITLPTRDRTTALEYLQDESSLLESTWEKNKFQKIPATIHSTGQEKKYLLLFPRLVLPGVDAISPEIEVQFIYANGLIEMKSGNWTLRGDSGNILKDSRFLESFNILVEGQLGIPPLANQQEQEIGALSSTPVVTKGWVEYRVQGEKPSVFKNAPPFVLDVTIKLIQDTVSEYATNQFSTRLLRGFRSFVMSKSHRKFLQNDSVVSATAAPRSKS